MQAVLVDAACKTGDEEDVLQMEAKATRVKCAPPTLLRAVKALLSHSSSSSTLGHHPLLLLLFSPSPNSQRKHGLVREHHLQSRWEYLLVYSLGISHGQFTTE
jgi:hypothetical protein